MNSKNKDDLSQRLASHWHQGELDSACGLLINDVQQKCLRYLTNEYGNTLSVEDCEDCFDYGVSKLLANKDSPEKIPNPYDYVWTCARNEAKDMCTEKNILIALDPERDGHAEDDNYDDETPKDYHRDYRADSYVTITEITLDTEIIDSNATRIIKDILEQAIVQLSKNRRKLINVLLEHGAFITNKLLAELLEISETATRSLKCYAFADLRVLIPQVARELGIPLDTIISPEPETGVAETMSLPTVEEDNEPLPPY